MGNACAGKSNVAHNDQDALLAMRLKKPLPQATVIEDGSESSDEPLDNSQMIEESMVDITAKTAKDPEFIKQAMITLGQ